jgi:pyruvate/2-oxoacid:ferredoxin oxidoreductase alpha subunit
LLRKFIEGNEAAAYGVKLSRANVITAFPITPQTPLMNKLAEMTASGELKAKYIRVESEHVSMSVCLGASAAGARPFTASCSQGIAFMTELIWMASGFRLPIVMAVVNRSISCPGSLAAEQADSLLQRDTGWIQFYCEDGQEVLDTIIQAYKIGEDERLYLPVMVCYDGFTISHTANTVDIPDQAEVDKFLPPYKHKYIYLDPDDPREIGVSGPKSGYAFETRYQMENTIKASAPVIEKVDSDFRRRFGRSYDGMVEEYQTDNADALLVTMGSITGTARGVVDKLRAKGKRIGLIKIRAFRPYPSEELRRIAYGVKTIGVIDRNFSHGSAGGGIGCVEAGRALINMDEHPKLLGFVTGLAGRNVTPDHIQYIADRVLKAAEAGKVEREVEWVGLMK